MGSDKLEQVDIRFICATNRDPLEAIAQQRLREDLYYRLNVVSIHLPDLAARGQDVLLLAHHFLKLVSEQENKLFVGISRDAEALLCEYPWPGNVRQLHNCILYGVIMSDGPLLTHEAIRGALKISPEHKAHSFPVADAQAKWLPEPLPQTINLPLNPDDIVPLAMVEEVAIKDAVHVCRGNIVEAACALGLSPSTLYRKMACWAK